MPATTTAERGLVVAARYRLESILGEGGMAVVWAAVHTETDRKVALKLVRADFVQDEKVRELFVQEARVAARIGKHDNIVDVLDAGVDTTLGVPFIAMELLQGATVESRLRAGPIAWPMASDLLSQLGDALEQAHAAGVFHRDLKPANLFMTADRKGAPKLKVLDFGIAKLSESAQKAATHIGTPAYAAPEQLGDAWRAIAAREGKTIATQVSAETDVWALGLIAFEMLTGAAPGVFWGAQTLAELPVKMVMEPTPLAASRVKDASRIPPGFDAWLSRCLDIDSRKRWPGAHAAVEALLPSLKGSVPPPARAVGTPAAGVAAGTPGAGVAAAPGAGTPGAGLAAAPSGPPAAAAAPLAGGTVAAGPLGMGGAGAAPGAPGAPIFGPTPVAGGYPVAGYPAAPGYGAAQAGYSGYAQGAAYPGYAQGPDPRLVAWAAHHQAELRGPADPRSFAWPVQYLPRAAQVPREARLRYANGHFVLAEIVTSDPLRQAVGEDRLLIAVVQASQFRYRAAVRSQRSSGVVDGVAQGLKGIGDLFSSTPGGLLRDPQFEAQYEVWSRNYQEAHAAVTVPLRQQLFALRFHGILELFPGAMMVTLFDAPRFEPQGLDRVMDTTKRIAAVFGA